MLENGEALLKCLLLKFTGKSFYVVNLNVKVAKWVTNYLFPLTLKSSWNLTKSISPSVRFVTVLPIWIWEIIGRLIVNGFEVDWNTPIKDKKQKMDFIIIKNVTSPNFIIIDQTILFTVSWSFLSRISFTKPTKIAPLV